MLLPQQKLVVVAAKSVNHEEPKHAARSHVSNLAHNQFHTAHVTAVLLLLLTAAAALAKLFLQDAAHAEQHQVAALAELFLQDAAHVEQHQVVALVELFLQDAAHAEQHQVVALVELFLQDAAHAEQHQVAALVELLLQDVLLVTVELLLLLLTLYQPLLLQQNQLTLQLHQLKTHLLHQQKMHQQKLQLMPWKLNNFRSCERICCSADCRTINRTFAPKTMKVAEMPPFFVRRYCESLQSTVRKIQ